MNDTTMTMLDLAAIRSSPTNPRKKFDDVALAELAESIKAKGVLQPILVRPQRPTGPILDDATLLDDIAGSDSNQASVRCADKLRREGCINYGHLKRRLPAGTDDLHAAIRRSSMGAPSDITVAEAKALALAIKRLGKEGPREAAYELVAGERRWRASKLAGTAQIPAIVRNLSDKEVAEIQVIENLQREGLDPVEEAEGYQRLIKDHGYTAEDLAKRLSRSEAYIYGSLKLALLPANARDGLAQGKISKNHGILIGRIPNEALRAKAAERILHPKEWHYQQHGQMSGQALSFRDAKRVVEEEFMVELKGAAFDRKSLTLAPSAGACTTCPKLAGNNRKEYPDGRADMCTDPACFRQKEDAHRKAQAAKAEAKGMQVLSKQETKKHFTSWGERYDSPYVDLAKLATGGSKAGTYRQLVGEELKAETVVAFDSKGKAHYLVPKEKALAALQEQGIDAGPSANGNGRHDADQARWAREREIERAVRGRFRRELYGAIARRLVSAGLGLSSPATDMLRIAVERILDRSDVGEDLAELLGVELPDEGVRRFGSPGIGAALIKDRSGTELLTMLVYDAIDVGYFSPDHQETKATCQQFGIDAKQLKKDAIAELKAKEKAEKAAARAETKRPSLVAAAAAASGGITATNGDSLTVTRPLAASIIAQAAGEEADPVVAAGGQDDDGRITEPPINGACPPSPRRAAGDVGKPGPGPGAKAKRKGKEVAHA